MIFLIKFLAFATASFLCIGDILAIFSLSGKIPVFNIWFIIIIKGFINASLIVFINFVDKPSRPKLVFGAFFSIIDSIVDSFTFLNLKLRL